MSKAFSHPQELIKLTTKNIEPALQYKMCPHHHNYFQTRQYLSHSFMYVILQNYQYMDSKYIKVITFEAYKMSWLDKVKNIDGTNNITLTHVPALPWVAKSVFAIFIKSPAFKYAMKVGLLINIFWSGNMSAIAIFINNENKCWELSLFQ